MIVRGQVAVTQNNEHSIQFTPAANTGTAIMPPGGTTTSGTGSYLDSIIVELAVFTTVGSCVVAIGDGNTGTVTIFPNVIAGTTTLINQSFWQIFIGRTSRMGPWRLTTGGNCNIVANGTFAK